jgi:multidrug efflux pump subunit AcrA (membrane-fusion protein)
VTFDVDVAEVRLPVTQGDLHYIDINALRVNTPIEVSLTARLGGSDFTWQAIVRRSEGVFDATSRVLYLVAEIVDPYDLDGRGQIPLLMGTFVSAEIRGREAGELVLVPRHALQRGSTLWLVDDNQKIFPREVEVVRRDDDFAYIAGGVEAGERYCVTPLDQPLPGMKVRLGT